MTVRGAQPVTVPSAFSVPPRLTTTPVTTVLSKLLLLTLLVCQTLALIPRSSCAGSAITTGAADNDWK